MSTIIIFLIAVNFWPFLFPFNFKCSLLFYIVYQITDNIFILNMSTVANRSKLYCPASTYVRECIYAYTIVCKIYWLVFPILSEYHSYINTLALHDCFSAILSLFFFHFILKCKKLHKLHGNLMCCLAATWWQRYRKGSKTKMDDPPGESHFPLQKNHVFSDLFSRTPNRSIFYI